MKKESIAILLFLLAVAFKTSKPANWQMDTLHSSLRFSVNSLMISDIEGSFKIKSSTITGEKEDLSDAVVTMVADVNTIDTDVEERDTHLKSPDFFDAAKYPEILFKSTKFEKVGEKEYKVTGDLTFHGITKPIVLHATANYAVHPVTNKKLVGFRVKGTVRRTDYGIAQNMPTDMLGDDVHITANTQFVKD
jgi:Uncharacterized conserved protein